MGKGNKAVLFLFILCGIVLGGFAGYFAKDFSFLSWLNYGQTFGTKSPFTLDLGIIILTFGITLKISISSILGVLIAVFIYKHL